MRLHRGLMKGLVGAELAFLVSAYLGTVVGMFVIPDYPWG